MADSTDESLQSVDVIVKRVTFGDTDEIISPSTPSRYSKPVIIAHLPLDSLSRGEWDRMHEKNGYESPSTVSITSFSSDSDLLPMPPLHNHAVAWSWKEKEHSDDSTSEHSHVVSLHFHHHASVIQGAVRRFLAQGQVSSSKSAKQEENEYEVCYAAATKIQTYFRSWRAGMLTLLKVEKRMERTQHQADPTKWVKRRVNEKNRCHAAATKIQTFFRLWRTRTLLLIDKMEKRLERIQRQTVYALHWEEQLKRHDMKRIKRDMVKHTEIDQYLVERDLSETLKVVEHLRTKNRKLRMSNQDLIKANETRRKENQKLQSENTSFNKIITLISARLPRLKGENLTLVKSNDELENSIKEYQRSVHQVREFWELETKTTASTKAVIIKILSAVKGACVDDEVARTITEVGVAKLERNEEHSKFLLKEARRKIIRQKTAPDEENDRHDGKVDRSSHGRPEKVPPPKDKMVKKSSQKSLVENKASVPGYQPGKTTVRDPVANYWGQIDGITTGISPVKLPHDGVGKKPGRKSLDPPASKENYVTTRRRRSMKSQLDEVKKTKAIPSLEPSQRMDWVHNKSKAKSGTKYPNRRMKPQLYEVKKAEARENLEPTNSDDRVHKKPKESRVTTHPSSKTNPRLCEVKEMEVRKSLGPLPSEDRAHKNGKETAANPHSSRKISTSIKTPSSGVASNPSVRTVMSEAVFRRVLVGRGASGSSKMQTDRNLTKTSPQKGHVTRKEISTETPRKVFQPSRRISQKMSSLESTRLRVKGVPVNKRSPGNSTAHPTKSMVVKRVETKAGNAEHTLAEEAAIAMKRSTKLTTV
mmetsp:Transcript_12425/g.23789  ORF Transcript_12425/g.23789 Transcript_12425/m.23789 type:complete len:817 (-) Transcript_12425:108-2558(-)|eukprot:scaffold2335_cov175-Amphora_coffeaeformis.AAC.13